jgi:hypothetical protein
MNGPGPMPWVESERLGRFQERVTRTLADKERIP